MPLVEDLKQSIFKRTFMGANPLPYTSYVLSLTAILQKITFLKIFISDLLGCILVFFICNNLFSKIMFGKGQSKFSKLDFAILAFYLLRSKQVIQATLSGLLVFMIIKRLNRKQLVAASLTLSLLSIADSSFIPMFFLVLTSQITEITKKFVNPEIKIKEIVKDFIKAFLLVILLPIFFACTVLFIDLLFKNCHSEEALDYTLPFQARLKNFDIKNNMGQAHKSKTASETDLYVMDRSQISLINAKHRSFFRLEKEIKTMFDSNIFCEIHKVHQKEFSDEEPRLIKNGDIVKFKDLGSEMFLGLEKKDGKAKFKNPTIGEFKDKEDFWVVETDGYLKARSQTVRFRSIKSADYLCARKLRKYGSLAVSQQAEEKSKNFYITENENHLHYKTTFQDPRPNEKVSQMKKLTFAQMFNEYISSIDLKAMSFPFERALFTKMDYISMFLMVSSYLSLLVCTIVNGRLNKKNNFSDETVNAALCNFFLILALPIIGLKYKCIEISALMFSSSLIRDLMKNLRSVEVYPIKGKYFNRKRQ